MSVRRSIGWSAAGQTAAFAIQFIASVIVARLLSPTEMGVFAVGLATLALFSSIEAFGLQSMVVREPELNERLVASATTINGLIALAIAAATALASTLAGGFFGKAGVTHVMALIAIGPLVAMFEFRPLAMLQRNMKFGAMALVSVTRGLVAAIVSVILAYRGFSYMSLAWGYLAGASASVVVANVMGRQYASLRLSLSEWRRLTRFGLEMLAIAGLSSVAARLSELLLGRLVGLAALGIYSRASNLTSSIFTSIHVLATRVVFADFAERLRRNGSIRDGYLRTLEIMTALLWPMFAGIGVLSRPVITWLYGEKWNAAAGPLAWLCAGSLILVAVTMAWEVFVVRQETARQVRIEGTRTALGLALFSIGCTLGLNAAAAARVVEAAATFALYRPHLARLTGTTNREAIGIFARSGLLTALAIGPAAMLMASLGWPHSPPMITTAAALLAGVALWAAGLYLLKHPLFAEASRLAARLTRA